MGIEEQKDAFAVNIRNDRETLGLGFLVPLDTEHLVADNQALAAL
jgi:hypothetical protein